MITQRGFGTAATAFCRGCTTLQCTVGDSVRIYPVAFAEYDGDCTVNIAAKLLDTDVGTISNITICDNDGEPLIDMGSEVFDVFSVTVPAKQGIPAYNLTNNYFVLTIDFKELMRGDS